jgi:hypothetical protein
MFDATCYELNSDAEIYPEGDGSVILYIEFQIKCAVHKEFGISEIYVIIEYLHDLF